MKRTSDVPEQFYGYSIQLPRLAVHLLEASPGAHVCLEHIDDVATIGPSGQVDLEQSKSAFTANPIADRALPFWKTLSNWVDLLRAGRVTVQSTRFRLHVAQKRECGSLIAMLRDASTAAEAEACINAARNEFWGPSPIFPLRAQVPAILAKFVENVLTTKADDLTALVVRMGIDVGTGDSIDEVRRGVQKQLVSRDQVDDLVRHVLGWLQETVHSMIEAGDVVMISRDAFFGVMHAYVRKYDRILQLSPWAKEPSKGAIDQELERRRYVRQLDLIEADADDKIRAAADYLKAIVDRTKWSERGDVESSSFGEFEDDLQRQWRARLKEVSIEYAKSPQVSVGKLLYARCEQYRAKLQNMEPTSYFTMGCFHSLADELKVGWHPQYADHLSPAPGKKAS